MKKVLTILLLCSTAPALQAAEEFTYHNKPISPACFSKMLGLEKTQNVVSLATCANLNADTQTEHTRYAVIGRDGNKFFVVTHQNTGGSGDFSNAVWVEKSADSLKLIKILAGGDRCNKGVQATGIFQYNVHLTPVGLVNMGSGAPLNFGYRDLDDSASSCVAEAVYQFNPKTESSKLKEVKFNTKPLKMEQWVLDINFQYCFTRFYNSFLERGQISLNQTDLDRFKIQFESICMRSGR